MIIEHQQVDAVLVQLLCRAVDHDKVAAPERGLHRVTVDVEDHGLLGADAGLRFQPVSSKSGISTRYLRRIGAGISPMWIEPRDEHEPGQCRGALLVSSRLRRCAAIARHARRAPSWC